MRWTLIGLLAVLVVVGISACALVQRAGVQRVAATWTLPPAFDACQVRGDRVWVGGRWLVTVVCPDGLRLLDERTKRETNFVSWAELYERDL